MCKTIAVLLGPGMLNVISNTSDLYIVLNFMYNAFFYFMPIFLGYSAARTLNISPIYGVYLGALIIVPDFMAMIGVRDTLSVFGVTSPVANYSSSFLPVIIGVWIMSYILRLLNKFIPDVLKSVFVPLLLIIIMAPIMFAICAPLGTYVGNVVGNFFIALSQSNIIVRTLTAVILAVLLPYMVLGGMHGALVNFAIMTFTTNGFETFLLPIMLAYNFAVFGVTLGAIIKLKKPENRTAVISYFITGILGSITEPCLYGVIMKYKQTMKALLAACAVLGLIVGIFTPVYYVLTSATIFTFWIPWVAGGTVNLISGVALMLVAFFSGTVAACFVGYDEN
jgi:PTS system beta-glucosides-specific IIC component